MKTRVRHGDYLLNAVPPERTLATEMGVSYMTARRAVQVLIEDGYLVRQSNGRLSVNPCVGLEEKSFQVAVLLMGGTSANISWLSYELDVAARNAGGSLRSVLLHHWDDPTVLEAVNKFQGAFLIPSSTPLQPSQQLLNKLKAAEHPVIVLDADWTSHGFLSIQPFPPATISSVMDYLASLGSKKIDCLNVQAIDATGMLRIAQWQSWQDHHGCSGELFNVNVQGSYYELAHDFMRSRLEAGYRPQAILCITAPAAVGASRALADFGIKPGVDVSLCAINGEGLAQFVQPSVTALEPPCLTRALVRTMKWLATGEKWSGTLLIDAGQPDLVIRESTIKPSA